MVYDAMRNLFTFINYSKMWVSEIYTERIRFPSKRILICESVNHVCYSSGSFYPFRIRRNFESLSVTEFSWNFCDFNEYIKLSYALMWIDCFYTLWGSNINIGVDFKLQGNTLWIYIEYTLRFYVFTVVRRWGSPYNINWIWIAAD